jgi:hypothetical protein
MTDDGDADGVPETDPKHICPAGDLADLFESGQLGATVADDADREELREWLEQAEAGEFGADPGIKATVRIVRSLLEEPTDDADP